MTATRTELGRHTGRSIFALRSQLQTGEMWIEYYGRIEGEEVGLNFGSNPCSASFWLATGI